MSPNGVITFITDFGTKDVYAGILKGIVLSINPDARIVDITHEIPSHDIMNASFMLANAYHHFPVGTIHVVIVDPGVGSERKNIAVRTEQYFFVGPDNGVFSLVLSRKKALEIRKITTAPFIFDTISYTFHGRDVYAPCAGHLSSGKHFSGIGPELREIVTLTYPEVDRKGNTLTGEVVSIDTFGNMITNISQDIFRDFTSGSRFEIYFATERFQTVSYRYTDVSPGSPLVLFGSSGHLEISMNGGSAAAYFITSTGSTVTVRRS